MADHDWDVFAGEEHTEVHHKDCDQMPESSYPTGDANANFVHNPEEYAVDGETFDRSCECLDSLLGDDPDREPPLPHLNIGDHVTDREDPDATMLVVNLDTLRADSYQLDDGTTVADFNNQYPADDDVVEVVFPQRTDLTLDDKQRYAYPRQRLKLATPVHTVEEGEE